MSIVNKPREGGKWDPIACSIKPGNENIKRGQNLLKEQVENGDKMVDIK